MGTRLNTRRSGEFRYATRHLALEKGKRSHQTKDVVPLRACKQLLKSDDWEKSKFSLIPKNSTKKLVECRSSSLKETRNKRLHPKNREKVVIVSKKSSSVRVVKSGSQRCLKGVQRSVSVKKVSYSTSVILSSDDDGDEDDESDSEDEDDDCDDEDDDSYHEKPRTSTRKRGTVIKHTTSKIKTNYCSSKKTDNRASKKAKALKLLRDKSNKRKSNASSYRELRPRFPYSPTQEWPTARAHRMASLNALAKVHVLYENEGRAPGESEENDLMELLTDDVSSNDSKTSIKDCKCGTSSKEKDAGKTSGRGSKSIDTKSKPIKKTRKRKIPPDVEIIDTRICKRMASLNAQAILAASYLQEKPRKREKIKKVEKPQSSPETDVEYKEIILESSCNLQIVDSEKDQSPLNIDSSPQDSFNHDTTDEDGSQLSKKHKQESSSQMLRNSKAFKNQNEESRDLSPLPSQLCIPSPGSDSNTTSATSVSEVGVTKYTQVTKVHINSTKELEIKEESKAERKIESILEKDDVAITEMYHYQSNTSSQSYSVRMETTYKPVSRNFNSPSSHQRSGPIPSPHVMGAVMPTRQSYYNYHNRPGILASQSYPMNRGGNNLQPILSMDPQVARQYGSSAFTVPHYGQSPHMAYPRNDYSYYQPAGPMIQPGQEQYMIHKPVPFHPHPPAQLQSSASATTSTSSLDHYPSSNEACFSRQSLPSSPEVKPKPTLSRSELPSSPLRNPQLPSSSRNPSIMTRQSLENPPSGQRVNTHSYDSRPHASVPAPHMHGQYTMLGKSENLKYGMHGTQNYTRSQDHLMYSTANHRERSMYSSNQPNQASSYHTKTPSSQESPNFNQYVTSAPMQHTRNISKFEHTKSSDNKQSHGYRQHDLRQYRSSGNFHRSSDTSTEKANKHKNLWRPPTVIDVEKECESRNTKTYIELDVPKACPQEKIVVVDVDKDDLKEQSESKCDPVCLTPFPSTSLQEKSIEQPDIIEIGNPKLPEKANVQEHISKTEAVDSSSDSPDIMVIGVMKKKEPSALIRRAKLHGKQRTYRDSENRPLAPYTNLKKAATSSTSEAPFDHKSSIFQPQVSISRLVLPENFEAKLLHGWAWDGKPSEKLVYVRNDDPPFLRLCYPAIRHHEGDVVKVRDCVLLKSGARKTDLPFIAKVTALWENPTDGEMMMSLLWYYRPEHTEPGRKPFHVEGEIFASKHCDTNSVACIEDKCYVLTSGEYYRYRRHCKMLESTCQSPVSVVPPIDDYARKERLPPSCISPEMVFFCRKVYDFRQKRILKNPM